MIKNPRICQVLTEARWVTKPFRELKKHDYFRLFESNGEKVEDKNTGRRAWRALCDAYIRDGVALVNVETDDPWIQDSVEGE